MRNIDDWNGYVESNGDFLFDVDGDKQLDVIAGFVHFRPQSIGTRNPGAEDETLGKMWPKHLLVDTGDTCNEGQLLEDIDGDGRPDWIVNSWKQGLPMRIWRLVDCPRQEKAALWSS